jgi:hypothetical protein
MFRPSPQVLKFFVGETAAIVCVPSMRTYVVLGVLLPVVFSCLFCFLRNTKDRELIVIDCSNYRRISLLSTSYKILSNILLSRLSPYIDEIIGDHQCGFRRNRSINFLVGWMTMNFPIIGEPWGTVHRFMKTADFWLRRKLSPVRSHKVQELRVTLLMSAY